MASVHETELKLVKDGKLSDPVGKQIHLQFPPRAGSDLPVYYSMRGSNIVESFNGAQQTWITGHGTSDILAHCVALWVCVQCLGPFYCTNQYGLLTYHLY